MKGEVIYKKEESLETVKENIKEAIIDPHTKDFDSVFGKAEKGPIFILDGGKTVATKEYFNVTSYFSKENGEFKPIIEDPFFDEYLKAYASRDKNAI